MWYFFFLLSSHNFSIHVSIEALLPSSPPSPLKSRHAQLASERELRKFMKEESDKVEDASRRSSRVSEGEVRISESAEESLKDEV